MDDITKEHTKLSKTPARSTSIIEDNNGKSLVEEHFILKLWTVYCQELYNYPIKPNHIVIHSQIIEKVTYQC